MEFSRWELNMLLNRAKPLWLFGAGLSAAGLFTFNLRGANHGR